MQSRAATDPEVAAQLTLAANRVATIERVHRRLHRYDNVRSVDLDSARGMAVITAETGLNSG